MKKIGLKNVLPTKTNAIKNSVRRVKFLNPMTILYTCLFLENSSMYERGCTAKSPDTYANGEGTTICTTNLCNKANSNGLAAWGIIAMMVKMTLGI